MNEDLKIKVRKFLSHPATIPVAVGMVSGLVGFGAGYIFGKREDADEAHELPEQMKLNFDDASKVIEELRYAQEVERYSAEPKVRFIEDPNVPDTSALDELNPQIEERVQEILNKTERLPALVDEGEKPMDQAEEVRNVFANTGDPNWDYEEEKKKRSTKEPYILHRDEFFEDEMGYTQTTLSYYDGDDIMADQDEKPVYNYLSVTGPLKFGHGSGDPNVVYIRNDSHRAEYEVLFHEGLYSFEVLGLEIENNERVKDLKHSANPKFRTE